MNIPAEVRRIVQARLGERCEDAAVLRGPKGEEWHAAYDRLRNHVYRKIKPQIGEDWREWERMREQVMAAVRECVRELEGR